jgi:hypothetical protein
MESRASNYFKYGQAIREPAQAPYQLWISGQHFAKDTEALLKHNIRAVCSVGGDTLSYPS